MQVVLFNNETILKCIPRKLGSLKSRNFKIKYSLNLNNMSESRIEEFKKIHNKEREYKDVLGAIVDSHYSVELLGVTSLSREYGLNIDLSDNLDLVLSVLCGCSPFSVRTMPNYDTVSRTLLSLNTRNFNIPISDFLGLSRELDFYIINKIQSNSDEYAMESILSDIMHILSNIICYIGFYLEDKLPGCAVRSINKCNILLQSSLQVEFSYLDIVTRDSLYTVRANCFLIDNRNNRRV